jgi:multiple sugar transport system substrate-binding protein
MSRRLALAVVGVLAVAAIAATASPGSTHQKKALSGTVTLSGWTSSGAEFDLLKQVIAGFEKKYPKIKVNYQPVNGDYPTAMLAKFAARKPPDVFYVDSSVAPDWMSQGVLEPLDSFIKKNNFSTKAFYPRLLNGFEYKGHIYGFPKDWSPLAMEVNTSMLAKAGVSAPQTWGQLISVAKKLQTSGAVPGGAPICISADWARLLAFVYQNKGTFLNAAKTAPTVQSPAVKGAVNFYVGLLQGGLAQTPDKLSSDWCGTALGKEKAAIIFEGNWLVPFMHDTYPNVKYGIFPMIHAKQHGNLAFTVSYSMAKDSKNKDLAWVLLSYLTGKQGMQKWTSLGLALPSRSDVKPAAGRAAFLSEAPYARPWQFAPKFSTVMTTANNELTAVMQGKEDVTGMLNKIAASAGDALKH